MEAIMDSAQLTKEKMVLEQEIIDTETELQKVIAQDKEPDDYPIMPPSSTRVISNVNIVRVKGQILPFDEEDLIYCEVKPK